MIDAVNTDDQGLLTNTPAQAESLLLSLKQQKALDSTRMYIKLSTYVLN